MKKSFVLVFLLLLLPWLSARAGVIDNFNPYLEYETFRAKNCRYPLPKVVCGVSTSLLEVSAELDRSQYTIYDFSMKPEDKITPPVNDAFLLVIKKRESLNQPFQVLEFSVAFTYRDGVVISYKKDYYDRFSEVRKNREIPMGVRRWLVNIMAALKPGFSFNPRE